MKSLDGYLLIVPNTSMIDKFKSLSELELNNGYTYYELHKDDDDDLVPFIEWKKYLELFAIWYEEESDNANDFVSRFNEEDCTSDGTPKWMIIFCGDVTYGDSPDGPAYSEFDHAAKLNFFELLGIV